MSNRTNGRNGASIALFEYLCLRAKEIGVRSIHGVSGGLGIGALELVGKCGLRWIGNCNALNAGYAADGYARVNGISALMTIMGAGELSALNAMAGAFAEYVPIIHIISKPSRSAHSEGVCLQHTLGDGGYEVFEKMNAAVSCIVVSLDCAETAPALIDEAIRECWIQRRPVTIYVPSDLVSVPVEGGQLCCPLDLSVEMNDVIVDSIVEAVIGQVRLAKRPVMLIGGYGVTQSIKKQVLELADSLGIPSLASATGRGVIDECHRLYAGLYIGKYSTPEVTSLMSSVDLVISIGNVESDLETPGFTGKLDPCRTIDMQINQINLQGEVFPDLHIQGILQALVNRPRAAFLDNNINNEKLPLHTVSSLTKPNSIIEKPPPKGQWLSRGLMAVCRLPLAILPLIPATGSPQQHRPLKHDWLWSVLGNWLQKEDIILAEAGTSNFGIWQTSFPPGVTYISQHLWASTGYTVGACQGAALAARDSSTPRRRTILFIGDTSFQGTCQELGTIIKLGLTPIIFIMCNSSHTKEKLIHEPDERYNDIQPWNFRSLPAAFGAAPGKYRSHKVQTTKQLLDLFADESFGNCPVLQMVELHLPQDDAPSSLKKRNI